MTDEPVLLTARELAAREGVSLRTVRRWKAAGRLPEPIVTVSRGDNVRHRWRLSDLDRDRQQRS